MIDKIIFYINDVDVDAIEKSLWEYGSIDEELDLVGLDKKRGISKYGTILNNAITIKIHLSKDGTYTLRGHGSLQKFFKGNNYSSFSVAEAQLAITTLGKSVGIPLDRFILSSIEIGVNIPMSKEPMIYIDMLSYYRIKKWPFTLMKPLAKSSQYHGRYCRLSEYEIKFYDKTFEATYRKTKLKDTVPSNVLRYEIQLFSKKYHVFGFKNIKPLTADKLLNPRLYNRFIRTLRKTFDDIYLDDIDKDYSKKLPEDVKEYIFVSSDNYDLYLGYLEKYRTKKEYQQAKKHKRYLEKEFQSLKETDNIHELKSKFEEAISLIHDTRKH